MVTSDILLLGPSGSGKTQFTNAVTGSNFTIGNGLTAQTSEVQSRKFLQNPEYAIIDTPGFDNNSEDISEDTVVQIPRELTKLVTKWCRTKNSNSGQLRAIIYFYDLSQPRFIHCDLLNIKIMKKITESTGVNAIFIVTTKGDGNSVTQTQREERERGLNEKIRQHMGRELPLIPCRRDGEHAIEVVQHIIHSLSPVSSNPIAPTSYLSLPPPPFPHSPSASTLGNSMQKGEKITFIMPSPKQKSGFLGRIWRGVVKVWRMVVPSCQ